MKIAVVLINIGELPYADLSIKANTKYYKYFGIELRLVMDHIDKTEKYKPKWISSLVFELLPDFDFIIVQDLDVIPCNLNYNILDFVMYNELNFCVSYSRIGMKVSSSSFPYFKYNAGLFAYSKHYQKMFSDIFEYGKEDPCKFGTCDQYYINKYIGENELFINEIPIIFNTFYYPGIDFSKVAFCHYTYSVPNEQKLYFIEKYHPKDMIE